jgi:hypothetical protein
MYPTSLAPHGGPRPNPGGAAINTLLGLVMHIDTSAANPKQQNAAHEESAGEGCCDSCGFTRFEPANVPAPAPRLVPCAASAQVLADGSWR